MTGKSETLLLLESSAVMKVNATMGMSCLRRNQFSLPESLDTFNRDKNCFKQFLQDLNLVNCEVKAAVVFINSHFLILTFQ